VEYGPLGLGGETTFSSVFTDGALGGPPVREGDVACPSDMIAIADALLGQWDCPAPATYDGMAWGPYFLCPIGGSQAWEPDLGLLAPFDPGSYQAFQLGLQRKRHADRWNVLFCDGHVEGQTTKGLLDLNSDSAWRRWNRDHLSHIQQ
jgi:prepilin-type processing-associated H-X9-DG protein